MTSRAELTQYPMSRMVNIAAAAMKSAPWQGSDGIITEGASPDSNNDGVGFKGKDL